LLDQLETSQTLIIASNEPVEIAYCNSSVSVDRRN
jgi:hypothetical protein